MLSSTLNNAFSFLVKIKNSIVTDFERSSEIQSRIEAGKNSLLVCGSLNSIRN